MTKLENEILSTLSKEQLICIIDKYQKSLFYISETCVDESKKEILSKNAVEKIRNYIYVLPNRYNEKDLKAYLDFEIGKISEEEYRNIILS